MKYFRSHNFYDFRINVQDGHRLLGKRMHVRGSLIDGAKIAMDATLVGIWFAGHDYQLIFSSSGRVFFFADATVSRSTVPLK